MEFLKWSNQQQSMLTELKLLQSQELFSDCTIISGGKQFPVHRLVLSSCSDYFKNVFDKAQCCHPIIIMNDIDHRDLEVLLNYMYNGNSDIQLERFSALVKEGQALKIKGFEHPNKLVSTSPPKNTSQLTKMFQKESANEFTNKDRIVQNSAITTNSSEENPLVLFNRISENAASLLPEKKRKKKKLVVQDVLCKRSKSDAVTTLRETARARRLRKRMQQSNNLEESFQPCSPLESDSDDSCMVGFDFLKHEDSVIKKEKENLKCIEAKLKKDYLKQESLVIDVNHLKCEVVVHEEDFNNKEVLNRENFQDAKFHSGQSNTPCMHRNITTRKMYGFPYIDGEPSKESPLSKQLENCDEMEDSTADVKVLSTPQENMIFVESRPTPKYSSLGPGSQGETNSDFGHSLLPSEENGELNVHDNQGFSSCVEIPKNITLPEFSPAVLPYLYGEPLPEIYRKSSRKLLIQELYNYMKMKGYFHSKNKGALSWISKKVQEALLARYPHMYYEVSKRKKPFKSPLGPLMACVFSKNLRSSNASMFQNSDDPARQNPTPEELLNLLEHRPFNLWNEKQLRFAVRKTWPLRAGNHSVVPDFLLIPDLIELECELTFGKNMSDLEGIVESALKQLREFRIRSVLDLQDYLADGNDTPLVEGVPEYSSFLNSSPLGPNGYLEDFSRKSQGVLNCGKGKVVWFKEVTSTRLLILVFSIYIIIQCKYPKAFSQSLGFLQSLLTQEIFPKEFRSKSLENILQKVIPEA